MSNDTQVHPNFNAADADISILSSDGVLFRIHSINLKTNSTAFPTEITSNPNDPATFSEPSAILELLFAFLYPSPPHPTLTDLVLQPLAYAAHKYSIASAISLCNVMMIESAKSRDDEHPLELLEYVCRYMLDEDKRVEAAAIITLSSQTVRALEILDINVFAAWVMYRELWTDDIVAAGKETGRYGLRYWAQTHRREGWSSRSSSPPPAPRFKECLTIVHEKRRSRTLY